MTQARGRRLTGPATATARRRCGPGARLATGFAMVLATGLAVGVVTPVSAREATTHIAGRIADRQDGAVPLRLDAGDGAVAAAGHLLAPPAPPGKGAAPAGLSRRIGAFVSGILRWAQGRVDSDGVTVGVDAELPDATAGRLSVGGAASWSATPLAGDGAEDRLRTLSVAGYVAHAGTGGGRAHLIAGTGLAEARHDGGVASAALGFAEVAARWERQPLPGLTVVPDLRLAVATSGLDPATGTALDGVGLALAADLSLAARYSRRTGAGPLTLAADLGWQSGARGDAAGLLPARLDDTAGFALGFTADLEHRSGLMLHLGHRGHDGPGAADDHRVKAAVGLRF